MADEQKFGRFRFASPLRGTRERTSSDSSVVYTGKVTLRTNNHVWKFLHMAVPGHYKRGSFVQLQEDVVLEHGVCMVCLSAVRQAVPPLPPRLPSCSLTCFHLIPPSPYCQKRTPPPLLCALADCSPAACGHRQLTAWLGCLSHFT